MLALYIILAAIAVLIAVVLIRTFAFRPKDLKKPEETQVEVDRQRAVENMQQIIRCKTVSSRNPELVDEAEFSKFRELLKTLYPTFHERCELKRIGPSGILYFLKGQNSDSPCVFMSHYDVVPADESAWQKPAFEGIIEDGVLWGRGTLDTKITLLGALESAESLLKNGFVPKNDMYFSFSGDEEINGPSAPAIVDYLQQNGIKPAFVLDEGGAVVENVFPGVKKPCALIGTGEKGIMDVELSLESNGGHASAPPPHTLVGRLSAACVKVEKAPFKTRLTTPVAQMYDTLGRHSTFVYRMVFSNLWLFRPVLNMLCTKKGGEMNALMRTTCAFTMMKGSMSTNVLPNKASMVANIRIMGGDTTNSVIADLHKKIDDDSIKINKMHGTDPSLFSRTDTPGWDALKEAVNETWPKAIVSPYLMVAASDSRHFCRISDCVYRFSTMELTGEERASIHGNDERIPIEKIVKTVAFYTRLMKKL